MVTKQNVRDDKQGKIKIGTISHKGSHHHPHQIWNVAFRKSTNHALTEPPNTSHRVSHPSAKLRPTHSSVAYRPEKYRTIHRYYKITNRRHIQPGARERDTEQERDSVRRDKVNALTVGLNERASELAMAAWLDLV
jgi:hypothetical protein